MTRPRRARRVRRALVGAAVLGASLVLAGTGVPPGAGASTPGPAGAPPGAVSETPAEARGPHLTGRPEPSMTQRVVDSLIWAWLLIVLIGGPALWVWTGRRAAATPGDDDHPSGAAPGPPAARR